MQLTEQRKDTLVHVRSDGEFRLASVSWGRETVGSAVLGNVRSNDPAALLGEADRRYRSPNLRQLPREVEAEHKFQLGARADTHATDAIVDSDADTDELVRTVAVRRLGELSLLGNPLDDELLHRIARRAAERPATVRFVWHASGVGLVFDRLASHVTLVRAEEWPRLAAVLDIEAARLR